MFLERFVDKARHVEYKFLVMVQGQVVAFGERDCSLQRRNQSRGGNAGTTFAKRPVKNCIVLPRARSIGEIRSAGTVEFIYDAARDEVYFLEAQYPFAG